MTLRRSFLLIMALALILVLIATFVISRFTFIKSFQLIEEKHATGRIESVFTFFQAIEERLKGHARDWAAWDETYQFLKGENPEYPDRNLIEDTFKNLAISWMIYLDTEGEIVHQAGKDLPPPSELTSFISGHKDLWKFSNPEDLPRSGIISSSKGLILYATSAVITSKFEGPVVGSLILARLIDSSMLSNLESLAGSSVSLNLLESMTNRAQSQKAVEILSPDRMRVSGSIPFGRNLLFVEFELPRTIFAEARHTERLFAGLAVGCVLIILGLGWLFIERTIIAELKKLRRDDLDKPDSKGESLSFPLEQFRIKEFQQIAEVFNNLIRKQEAYLLEKIAQEKQIVILFNALPIGAALISRSSHTIIWANEALGRILGVSSQDLIGKGCEIICARRNYETCPVDVTGKGFDLRECQITTPQGPQKDVLKSAVLINYAGQECVLEVVIDITEKKQLEEKLHRAEKLEAIGLVAGQVAHELNNILTPLVLYPELLMRSSSISGKERHYLEAMMNASFRASDLVGDLLAMTRRQLPVKDVIALSDVIREVMGSAEMERLLESHPLVHFNFPEFSPEFRVIGSKAHLNRVIMNLLKNASEAIDGEGKVEVRVYEQSISAYYDGYERVPGGNYVVIEVSDTGEGIPPEHIPRIFEPFYTTKKLGRSGTGLGLNLVWNVVKDMEGYVDIESSPGQGTVIRLFIPKYVGEQQKTLFVEDYPPSGDNITDSSFPLRVLVVDDRPEQREMASVILKEMGAHVVTASGMDDAVSLFRSQTFDLVLLDMILEDKYDGLDVARELFKIKSNQLIAIVTGYGESDRVRKALNEGVISCIKKPYRSSEIKQLLKEVKTILVGGGGEKRQNDLMSA